MANGDKWELRRFQPDEGSPELGTGNADDDEVLRQLAKLSPPDRPRHWIHFLPCRGKASANAAGSAAAAAGWTVDVTSSRLGRDWCVIAEQHNVVISPKEVREARLFFESLVARIPGVTYDGWQASAER